MSPFLPSQRPADKQAKQEEDCCMDDRKPGETFKHCIHNVGRS